MQWHIEKWREGLGYANPNKLSKNGENIVSEIVKIWIKYGKPLGRNGFGLVDKLVENVDN